MSNVDDFRLEMMKHISDLPSLQKSWSAWQPVIETLIGKQPTAKSIYALGDNLEKVFKAKVVAGRTQTSVSSAGVAWEGLVCWYLNMVFYGTSVVVVRPHAKFLPKILSDALAVTISNIKTNTESDLVAFNIPDWQNLADVTLTTIDSVISAKPHETEISVMQCKSNWNDNAQIPMLWDLIYSSNSFRLANVSVGSNGVSPTSFKRFTYGFATVPTSSGKFTPSTLSVLRVKNLSGGNYWGRPSLGGVAKSVNEYCATNFGAYFTGTVQNSIQTNLLSNKSVLDSFLNLKF